MKNNFICNICGSHNNYDPINHKNVPGPLCISCNSATRFRKIAYILSKYVFNSDGCLFNITDVSKIGIGLSDAPPYSRVLSKFSGYTNTFYHKNPRVDIMEIQQNYKDLDYLISSDVFEHTPPPALRPFEVAYSMLKFGGVMILSVPTHSEYREHFPDLNDYQIMNINEQYVLANATKDGRLEVFKDIRFHGGPGSTIEMRLYSKDEVENNLRMAGFSSWSEIDQNISDFGIENIAGLSTIWLVTK